ncbi:MAG: hypothetical protein CPDRYMAC_4736 [uncultured Paraburkholderia sp.]|nr:MAG: hypothetical protein CPDRYDRY_4650 [uncultured Paraburkholderia sp.]CAH2937926.1 MAG: hypothetical protein CPDRYMAC_4736 [uncultured Paraburkholderia sp.]
MKTRQPTLKRPLIVQPLLVQLATLAIGFAVLTALLLRLDSGGAITQEDFAPVAAASVVRDAAGRLVIRPTDALREAQHETPSF